MRDRSIIIVGAGIGGLATGCYALMNGYQARIYEMHDQPGGQCTSWSRQGYVFDGCIHNLAGTSPNSAFHRMWRELGVVPRVPMIAYEEMVRVERPDGAPLTVYTDLDRLQAHMTELFPADGPAIRRVTEAARRLADFDLMGLARAGLWQRLKALRLAPSLLKWGSLTLEDYARRFSDPFLARAFGFLVYDWPKQPMLILLTFLGRMGRGDLGWPVGGSAAVAGAMARRFAELGGEIRYGATVERVLVENDRAVGVRLSDGTEQRGDIVVSNASGYATIFGMLDGRYTNRAICDYYAAPEDRIEMGIQVSLGLARDLSAEPHAVVLPLEEPVTIAGEERDRFYVQGFGFDPTMAPPGKSVLKVVFATSYRRWEELARKPDSYRQEKQRIAETVVRHLEPRFPGLAGQVEVTDVATPITTKRFTGIGHGYRSSAGRTALAILTGRRLSQTLPGLADFFMVGQWAGTPGVPLVANMGRDVARQICRRDGRRFRSEPEH